jgi:hypothetical protein
MRKWCAGKILPVLTLLLLLSASGCSPKHYAVQRGEFLSLYLEEEKAEKVFFASSLDQYMRHPAARLEDGTWEMTVPAHKEFEYFYLVDGVVTLPECQLTVQDDFGSKNCLFVSSM